MALEEEPKLIEVPSANGAEGTFTLQYKNRFLYSKYSPKKNILAAIASLEILPGTLVLVFSPCFFYGWKELKEKCKATGSEILCVEADAALHAFSQKAAQDQKLAATILPLDKNTPRGLDEWFCASPKKFRRVIRVDFSAGVSFAPEFYKNFFECAQNIVAAFWKNRLTLVRLGRLYCKNIFKNLIPAAAAIPFEALERTVEKPILVCGAGESLDELTKNAAAQTGTDCKAKKAAARAAINDRFFVLAVDAALPALKGAGIKIDAAAATESQLAIEKAYIGLKAENGCKTINAAADENCLQEQKTTAPAPLFFFDLTSRAQIVRLLSANKNRSQNQNCGADKNSLQNQNCGAAACFYFSEFDKNTFVGRLRSNGLLPFAAPPLGSVGLTATYLALRLRKDESVPIYVLGLDFSFSAGRTHAKGTAQSKALFLQAGRLRPAQNFAAAFGPASEKLIGKNGEALWSTKNLLGYAALFRDYFRGVKNLYDAGKSGLDLGLERRTLSDVLDVPPFGRRIAEPSDRMTARESAQVDNFLAIMPQSGRMTARESAASCSRSTRTSFCQQAQDFLRGELSALRALADLLSNGDKAAARDKSISLDEQIMAALLDREYLYLHFPDGTEPSLDKSFLTRVRSQIDFFAKDIETALAAAHI